MRRAGLVSVLLRGSLAFAFFYAGFGAMTSPENWVDFLPQFISSFVPLTSVLFIFGIFEILLAGWLLSGKKLLWSAGIATAMLAGIVIFNTWAFSVTFRDVSLAIVALALAVSSYKSSGKK